MFNKILLLSITAFLTTAVSAQQFSLTAKITGFDNGTKFYLEDPDTQIIIDSAITKDNSFVMKSRLDESPKGLFLSATAAGKYYWCYLFTGNEAIRITGDRKDFPFYMTISGSKSQDVYNILNDKIRSLQTLRNGLTENLGSLLTDESDSAKTKLKELGKKLQHIDSLTTSIRMTFINSNLNSYAGLNELYYLKERFRKDTLQQMYDGLEKDFRESIYGQRVLNYLKVGDILKVGDAYEDFEASDQFGHKHSISALKGRYILLDFTETYCGPCILSIDELRQVAKSYSDSLSVVSFCADRSRDTWQTGLSRDKQEWLCLWDGEAYYGKTILKYGITGYPTFVLIDPGGKIISKWSGYGKGGIESAIAGKISSQSAGH